MSKLQLFFYIFFFSSLIGIILIAFFYWLKFHRIEKKENQKGLQPKKLFDDKKGKVILGKSKDFAWEIIEDSEELEMKKYLGFDYFASEGILHERKEKLFEQFQNNEYVNLTTVEFMLLLRFSDYQAKIFSDGSVKFLKKSFFDFLNKMEFGIELKEELKEVERFLITDEKIKVDAKEIFYMLENKNLFYTEDEKNIFKNKIRDGEVVEETRIVYLVEKIEDTYEAKLQRRENELRTKTKTNRYEDHILIIEQTDEYAIVEFENGLQVKRYDAWTFDVYYDPQWDEERKKQFALEQKKLKEKKNKTNEMENSDTFIEKNVEVEKENNFADNPKELTGSVLSEPQPSKDNYSSNEFEKEEQKQKEIEKIIDVNLDEQLNISSADEIFQQHNEELDNEISSDNSYVNNNEQINVEQVEEREEENQTDTNEADYINTESDSHEKEKIIDNNLIEAETSQAENENSKKNNHQFKIIIPSVKKMNLKNIRNENKSFIGFFKETMTIEALVSALEHFPNDNKKNILKIIFDNRLAFYMYENSEIPALLKIDNKHFLFAPYLIYIFSLFFQRHEEFVLENKLVDEKFEQIDYNSLKKLIAFEKSLREKIFANGEVEMLAIDFKDFKIRIPLIELKENFMKDNYASLSFKIGHAKIIGHAETKTRINFGVYCEDF